MLLCGNAAAHLLLGRWWHRKSGCRPLVGYRYPVLAMFWLEPLLAKGSFGEWIMLGTWFAVPALLLVLAWRGRKNERLSWRDAWPLPVVLVGAPLVHLVFTLVGGHFEILWLVAASTVVLGGVVVALFAWSARAPLPSRRRRTRTRP